MTPTAPDGEAGQADAEGDIARGKAAIAMKRLAEEAFPMIQSVQREPWRVPPEAGVPGDMYLWSHLFRCIHSCEAWRAATDALAADPVIGPVADGREMFLAEPMGSGGAFQAAVLPYELIQAAALSLLACGESLTLETLVTRTVQNLKSLSAGIAGASFDGRVLHAFGGLRLNSGDRIATPWGDVVLADRLVRAVWVSEQDHMSAILCVQEPLTYARGERTGDNKAWQRQRRIASLVSYAVTLGSEAADPMAAVPLGVGTLLPTGMPGSGGEIRFVGLQRRQDPLTSAERSEIEKWISVLDGVDVEHIELGLARLCRSVGERHDPADSLVDAVIAWENLVEHSAEPSRSVRFGMSALVGASGKREREEAYGTRSAVVHGEHVSSERLRSSKRTAVSAAVNAFRSLILSHPEKLALTSDERVLALGLQLRLGATGNATEVGNEPGDCDVHC